MIEYVGNPLQTRGAEKYILQDGKGDGMHFLNIRNGLGLEAWVSLDRCGDISRLTFKGDNMGYFSPCGYVAPSYYDCKNIGFLKSFTAGFFTTCGLTAVGPSCLDDGEETCMHGSISNTPATLCLIDSRDDGLTVKVTVEESRIFSHKLLLERVYHFSYTENSFEVVDTVKNIGDLQSPYMLLYHCNMGYPLLDENSVVMVPNTGVKSRNEESAKYVSTALKMEKPTPHFNERCYYYDVKQTDGIATVGIYNDKIEKGLVMSYDTATLPCFTQWKMMGYKDYVLGLEPGNCSPDGRDVLRKRGELKFLEPQQSVTTRVKFDFVNNRAEFNKNF